MTALVGDVYKISERIRDFDPDLFLCGKPGEYQVLRRNPTVYGDRPQHVMSWTERTLDNRLIQHLRYGDTWSNQTDHVRKWEDEESYKERRLEEQENDYINEVAKEAWRAVKFDTR